MEWAWEPGFGSTSSEPLQVRAPEPLEASGQPEIRVVGKTSPFANETSLFLFPIQHDAYKTSPGARSSHLLHEQYK